MYGQLNPGIFGWKDEDGNRTAFVLSSLYQYAGMYSGLAPNGCITARPLVDFTALSIDGVTWYPTRELSILVPMEGAHVYEPQLPLPQCEPG